MRHDSFRLSDHNPWPQEGPDEPDPGPFPGPDPGPDPGPGPSNDPFSGPGPSDDPFAGPGPSNDPFSGPGPSDDPFAGPGPEPGPDPFEPDPGPSNDPFAGPGPEPGPADNSGASLDQLSALLEKQPASNSAAEQSHDVFGKIMTGFMGLGSIIGLGPALISIINYIQMKTKGQHPSPPSHITPQQQQDLDGAITTWIGLSDAQTWEKIYDLVKGDNLAYPQQLLLLKFVAATRPTHGKWEDETARDNLIAQLAGEFYDYQMYVNVWQYKYKGYHLPFAIGAAVVEAALTQKYQPY